MSRPGATVSSRATALPPDERRSMIVQATLPLVLEHGEMVTTRQIAEAAGIAEGTIFRVFPDKDALLVAVLDAVFDREPLERTLEMIDPGLDLTEATRRAVVALQQRVEDVWRVASVIGPRFRDSTRRRLTLSPWLVTIFSAHGTELRVPPTDAARLLEALTLSVTHPMLAQHPMDPQDVAQLFLHGVSGDQLGPTC